MKKHPLVDRIDSMIPKLQSGSLPNKIRMELEALLADIRSHLTAMQESRSRAGIAAKGLSGRKPRKPPAVAKQYLAAIVSGEMTANAAATELRKRFPNHECRFSAPTLRRWAAELEEKESTGTA